MACNPESSLLVLPELIVIVIVIPSSLPPGSTAPPPPHPPPWECRHYYIHPCAVLRQVVQPAVVHNLAPFALPNHNTKFFSSNKKMKFIKGAQNWRSILGTQTFFWPQTPPNPRVSVRVATKPWPGQGSGKGGQGRGSAVQGRAGHAVAGQTFRLVTKS